jgi:hypothetical protein
MLEFVTNDGRHAGFASEGILEIGGANVKALAMKCSGASASIRFPWPIPVLHRV